MVLTKDCARDVLEKIINITPETESALHFNNPFELAIAVMLSAQTTDRAVNKATPALFRDYPSPKEMAKAEPEDIQEYIKSIGLYRNKSKYAVGIARMLMEDFDGEVPKNRTDLMKLPGIGRKSANVILSVAFDIPAFAVDTHVTRVAKHHKIAEEDWNVRQIEKRITSVLPKELWKKAHMSMIRFGREICHPRNPECENYPELYTCQEFEEVKL